LKATQKHGGLEFKNGKKKTLIHTVSDSLQSKHSGATLEPGSSLRNLAAVGKHAKKPRRRSEYKDLSPFASDFSDTDLCNTRTHTHTCKWKFRNFSCELVRLKARFPALLISLFRSFRTQFLVSSGRVRFPATTHLPDAGLGLLCILILFIESIFPPIVATFSPSLTEKCKITMCVCHTRSLKLCASWRSL
jgi:hypothetical protein